MGIQALAAFDTHGGHLHVVEVDGQAHGFHLLLVVDFAGLPVEESCVDFFGVHEPLVAARKIQVRHGSLEKLLGVNSRTAQHVHPAGAFRRKRLATRFKYRVRLVGRR